MTAKELREALAAVPDDAVVLVCGHDLDSDRYEYYEPGFPTVSSMTWVERWRWSTQKIGLKRFTQGWECQAPEPSEFIIKSETKQALLIE
jgi:hypothetical protein